MTKVTPKQMVVLKEAVRRNDPASARQYADRLEKATPGTGRFTEPAVRARLVALEKKGLVQSIIQRGATGRAHRRRFLVTDAGRRAVKAIEPKE